MELRSAHPTSPLFKDNDVHFTQWSICILPCSTLTLPAGLGAPRARLHPTGQSFRKCQEDWSATNISSWQALLTSFIN